MSPLQRQWTATCLAAIPPAMLWLASPLLFHHKEPWDGGMALYFGVLFATGLIARLLVVAPLRFILFGAAAGQALGAFLPELTLGNLWPMALVMFFLYALPAYAGAWVASRVQSR